MKHIDGSKMREILSDFGLSAHPRVVLELVNRYCGRTGGTADAAKFLQDVLPHDFNIAISNQTVNRARDIPGEVVNTILI